MSWQTALDGESRQALQAVWQEIQAGRPDSAAARLRTLDPDSGAVRNARAVCLMLRGEHRKAVDLLRTLVFPHDGLAMDPAADPAWRANFCLALLRSGNQDGFRTYAGRLEPSGHPAVDAVRGLLNVPDPPRGSLGRLRRLFAGPPPIELPPDFPAGWPEQWLTPASPAPASAPPAPVAPSPARTSVEPRIGAVPPASSGPPPHRPARASATAEPEKEDAAKKRVIRVFISSTFRDMMRERDLLVKQVFPELRRKCAKRFVTFTEVDLRWGITEEQSAEGQVLPLCLAEIERSRPYFLGLLGERYGWIPDSIRPEVVEREPWLKEHLHDRTSVTELEILHGVLNNPKMTGYAFFYFRDPAYLDDPSLTESERRDLAERNIPAEIEKYGEAEAARRTEERKAKLAALKQRIRDSGHPLVEPYANPEVLAEIVRKQFNDLIDSLYPEYQTPDPLTQERLSHEAHAKNKLFGCIERPVHMKALTDFADRADTGGQGLVLTGESGGGKTALLAAWAQENPDDFLFQHYFGATPESASPEGFLHRLMGELKSRFGIHEEIPSDPEKLRHPPLAGGFRRQGSRGPRPRPRPPRTTPLSGGTYSSGYWPEAAADARPSTRTCGTPIATRWSMAHGFMMMPATSLSRGLPESPSTRRANSGVIWHTTSANVWRSAKSATSISAAGDSSPCKTPARRVSQALAPGCAMPRTRTLCGRTWRST